MADFPLDWSAGASMNPQGPLGIVNQGYAGAEEGYKLGQTGAIIHALQGIDLNNPDSVNSGIGALVKGNGLEQANALQNLQFTRWLRSQVPAWMQQLQDISADKQGSSQPGGSPSAGQTPGTDQTADAGQHVVDTLTQARDAAKSLAAMPEDQRPQAFEKIKADMLARGVPSQAIDSAGQHLGGDGPAQLANYYQGLLDHAGHQMNPQGEAPAVPAMHPSSTWAQNILATPQAALLTGLMKGAGIDFTPMLETAKSLALPQIQEAAKAQYAGPIAEATKGAELKFAPALAGVEAAKQIAVEAGTNPYKAALSQAQADIAAAHDTVKVPEVDKNGQPTGREVVYRKDKVLQAGSGGGAIGKSQSPGEQTGQTQDAGTFMERYKAEANQQAIQTDLSARDQAIASARLAQTLNPSNLTPWLAKNANTLNGLGFHVVGKDANNYAAYEQGLAQNVKNATTVFPRLTNEFHTITAAVPTAKTPGDAAALSLTATAAIRDMAAQEKQFRLKWAAEHPGEYSERGFQEAWSHQPQANQSIFASPLFRELKFNGQPAVKVYPPFTDGHVYGVFMPGTPQAARFTVR